MNFIKGSKYSALVGLILTLLLVVVQLFSPIKVVSLFPVTLFCLVTTYSTYLLFLFLTDNPLYFRSFVKYAAIGFFLFPVLLMFYQLIADHEFLEYSWPLVLGLIIFQGGLVLLRLLGYFEEKSHKSLVSNTAILLVGLISLFFAGLIFSKIIDEILFNILIGAISVLSLLAIVMVIKSIREK
jgi:hypothetical protein